MGYTLITGASSGIGREMALLCAEEHRDLVITARNEAVLNGLKKQIEEEYGVKVLVIPADLSQSAAPQQLYDATTKAGIHVDMLVNDAGFSDWTRFLEADWNKTEAMMQLNMHAVAQLSYLYGRDMVSLGSGKIVNISSIASAMPGPYMAMYYATKAFVRSLGVALAKELEHTGVTVTTICPGPVTTGFAKAANMHGKNFYTMAKAATPSQVAQFAYRKAMRGKALAYQGALAKACSVLVRIAPLCLLVAGAATMNGGDPGKGANPLRK
ncbi:SDR family NAD(P)-dependent oxidoreductase [Bifidobacterium magnum]|uniref:Oxidoreductase, short chain dehydrogenase/reductase family protein n=1 Tax=Bifidobacterium magnum TaxID=1692 RepID=A0A087BCE7_9BIFI|nr:SDR family oxidoreductase [Bifidobacterium magnum]KFI68697.1 Oxidoreductase, short chain dehydrogenase/reductase family protein [Bifidobacterium magnum]